MCARSKSYFVFTGSRPNSKKFSIGNVEKVRNILKRAGFKIVNNPKEADAVIVPTGATSNFDLLTYNYNDFLKQIKSKSNKSKSNKSESKTQIEQVKDKNIENWNNVQTKESLPTFDFIELRKILETESEKL